MTHHTMSAPVTCALMHTRAGAYHIDFAAPFSVMTAFALAVSSLCHKRLVQ